MQIDYYVTWVSFLYRYNRHEILLWNRGNAAVRDHDSTISAISPNPNFRFCKMGCKTGQKWITNLTFVSIRGVP